MMKQTKRHIITDLRLKDIYIRETALERSAKNIIETWSSITRAKYRPSIFLTFIYLFSRLWWLSSSADNLYK